MEEVERNFLLFLANGVTSTIDVGGDLTLGLEARERVREGQVPGPRLFLAGPILHCRDGQNPEAVKKVVNGLIDQGIDLVKFYICWTPPMVKAAIEAAHARGIPVSGHHGLTSPLVSAVYGTDIIHHALTSLGEMVLPDERRREMLKSNDSLEQIGRNVQLASWNAMAEASQQELNDLARRLAATGAYLASTFIVNHCYLTYRDPYESYDGFEFLSESGREFWHRKTEEVISSLKECPTVITPEKLRKRGTAVYEYWKSGGNLLAGTDVPSLGQVCGFSLQNELVLLQEAGIPPAAVIASATRNPAKALRNGDDLGTVEVGKFADLLVLEADPLTDVENTKQIRYVIKDGRIYEPKKLLDRVLSMERSPSSLTQTFLEKKRRHSCRSAPRELRKRKTCALVS
jgi:hypothetical protein